jgi:peptidyl-tRNA hydrolase, PTH1 family
MKLIIGLGNPEQQYERTWHNLGFLAIEEIIKEYNFPPLKKKSKFQAEISEGEIGGHKIILAKPLTYMNNSGLAVSALAGYFKLKLENIIVIHDDLDLISGRIKIVKNSSDGGHNGIKSIISQLSSKEFVRIKLGIKTDRLEFINPADYVLTGWKKEEWELVKEQLKKAGRSAINIITEGIDYAKNHLN